MAQTQSTQSCMTKACSVCMRSPAGLPPMCMRSPAGLPPMCMRSPAGLPPIKYRATKLLITNVEQHGSTHACAQDHHHTPELTCPQGNPACNAAWNASPQGPRNLRCAPTARMSGATCAPAYPPPPHQRQRTWCLGTAPWRSCAAAAWRTQPHWRRPPASAAAPT